MTRRRADEQITLVGQHVGGNEVGPGKVAHACRDAVDASPGAEGRKHGGVPGFDNLEQLSLERQRSALESDRLEGLESEIGVLGKRDHPHEVKACHPGREVPYRLSIEGGWTGRNSF